MAPSSRSSDPDREDFEPNRQSGFWEEISVILTSRHLKVPHRPPASVRVRGKAQSRRQAGHLHPLVVRPIVAATRSRRGANDLPQPLSRKALLGRDVGVTGAILQASEDALQAQRARRRRKGRAAGARRRSVSHKAVFLRYEN